MEGLFVVWFIMAFVFACLGGWIAEQKHREMGEGIVLGALFGPLGALIEAVLPTLGTTAAQPSVQPELLTQAEKERQVEQWKKESAEKEAQRQAAERELEEWRRTTAAAKLRETIEREERERESAAERERKSREAKEAFVNAQRALWMWIPDWAKMIAVGLVLSLIVCIPLAYWLSSLQMESGPIEPQQAAVAKVPVPVKHAVAKSVEPKQQF